MSPEVVNVKPEKDYTLHLWFTNGEEGIFDVKPYLEYEVFQVLARQNIRILNPDDNSCLLFFLSNECQKREA